MFISLGLQRSLRSSIVRPSMSLMQNCKSYQTLLVSEHDILEDPHCWISLPLYVDRAVGGWGVSIRHCLSLGVPSGPMWLGNIHLQLHSLLSAPVSSCTTRVTFSSFTHRDPRSRPCLFLPGLESMASIVMESIFISSSDWTWWTFLCVQGFLFAYVVDSDEMGICCCIVWLCHTV